MTIKKSYRVGLRAACLLAPLAAALPASAQYQQAHFLQTDLGEAISISYPGMSQESVFAGQLRFRLDTGPNYTTLGNPFDTYCVDLTHSVSPGSSYRIAPRSTSDGLTGGSQIAYLYNTYGMNVQDNDHAAALQAAIWELTVDGNNANLATGGFLLNTTGNVRSYADAYLTAASGNSGSAFWMDAGLNGTVNSHLQNQLIPTVTISSTQAIAPQTPEPGAWALALALPSAAFALRRRRKQKNGV